MTSIELLNKDLKLTDISSVVDDLSLVVHSFDNYSDLNMFRHLNTLHTKYNLKIIIINSNGYHTVHPYMQTHFPHFITLSDPDQKWFNWLKQTYNLDAHTVPKNLRCNLLYKGNDIHFWHQPVQDEWKYFLQYPKAIAYMRKQWGNEAITWLKSQNMQDNKDVWNRSTLPTIAKDKQFLEYIVWYKLLPNHELIDILENSNIAN